MSEFNGEENYIQVYEKDTYAIRNELKLSDKPECHKSFLREIYKTIISADRWPEDGLSNLHDGVEEIRNSLDLAWLLSEEKFRLCPKNKQERTTSLHPSFEDYSIDQYYPRLQATKWPEERRERFKGHISVLDQMEVYKEYSFYDKLFGYKSLRHWKEHLDQWMEFALDNRSIIEAGVASASDVFQSYELLVKLTERIWLNQKEDRDVSYHDISPWFDIYNYPVIATMEFAFNPYDELYILFYHTTLDEYKRDLRLWMNAAINSEKKWEKSPADLINLFRSINLLTESLWLIKETGPNYPESWNNIGTYFSGKRAKPIGEKYKFKLKEDMIKKPENYLLEFFEHNTLQNIFHSLFEYMYNAFAEKDCYEIFPEEARKLRDELIKLLEAGYLIQAQKYPDRKNEH